MNSQQHDPAEEVVETIWLLAKTPVGPTKEEMFQIVRRAYAPVLTEARDALWDCDSYTVRQKSALDRISDLLSSDRKSVPPPPAS